MWRGYGSKHMGSGQSGDGWYRKTERVVAANLLPPHPPHPNFLRRRIGASGRRSEPRLSLSRGITEMGEAEAMYKSERVRERVCER